MLFEEKLIYYPVRFPYGNWERQRERPADLDPYPHIEDCWIETDDGVILHGWYARPKRQGSDPGVTMPTEGVLLWFHGNAGNLSHRYDQLLLFMSIHLEVFIVDYRGYGRSSGTPSEAGLYRDATAVWNWLTQEKEIDPRRIVILGKSLGGAVAVDLATRVQPAGLILHSCFTSIPDMARHSFPFIPSKWVRTQMSALEKVRRVTCPKLVMHSPKDEIVPYDHGIKLYEAAAEPKEFYRIAGAKHNDAFLVGGKPYFLTIRNFVRRCTAARERGINELPPPEEAETVPELPGNPAHVDGLRMSP